ncbi:uncharacterized protein LOC114335430 isoform X2 [Diabrotica virgifera virgifera]|uniref:Uncharacterized protein LOC114335430 n=1 Tax=Diabrotica virgifera virgifera TaxID=50390 RepID=A0A6P7FY98_DIAVI|nr:uncharacterized protein LOC114335430 isoform X2 [Diabrotica virgifera virgifera]XP_028141471.1 uncharacterized protein LOC114335430 isoform X2 [Diabrotica virgifera virgifera]XP_050499264.1 uncharacterized protein LOC114335430 isoform X2 [Diabrotica virgifera virgifera]XP_050499265.1 uncharacterized protein LOC114335430 isoform X2 [Diabrotica virgifera virgifera]XP_050499266.1 uncharacterized protein LOC114335430 isoform X2 [Diabrotica virgifera virgifera]
MAGYRTAYTIDEDNMILEIITATEGYYYLRGRAYWIDLVNLGRFNKCRTWMSIQNRFEKKILPDIMNSNYLIPEIEKHKIVLAWEQTADDFCSDDSVSDDNDDDTGIDEDNTDKPIVSSTIKKR